MEYANSDLASLSEAKKVIGVKQAVKAVEKGLAGFVYVAEDADKRLTTPLVEVCRQNGVTVETADSMTALGKACKIAVGAAAVAVLK